MKLILEDGTELSGDSFGAHRSVAGEVVFNTSMTGYIETLTDPSYRGQILVLTYPLIGNYGVPPDREAGAMNRPFESNEIQVMGLVVQNYVDHHSHHASRRSLAEWLKSQNIPLLSGIDTRRLTQKLREKGTMRGWVVAGGNVDWEKKNADRVDMRKEVFELVAPKETVTHDGKGAHILLVDAGCKDNICRSLLERGAKVTRAPYHADIVALAQEADGVLLGNGPGDPKDLSELIAKVRELLGTYSKPMMGVCLGNQILALAAGGDTGPLKYGHRSVNQPVQDLLTRRCYITSQNHGYHVLDESLPDDWEPWFVNLNDGTNEGVRHRSKPFFSVQFHPEASPGPQDTAYLFDDYLRLVAAVRS
ncbi:MAG: glutamine-hydrolyzing carbamoyl-phosphate synthase small subunit [Deltaproteobacteria bacterium]|jgi:carbamoyl-phosphate synthase small subunit